MNQKLIAIVLAELTLVSIFYSDAFGTENKNNSFDSSEFQKVNICINNQNFSLQLSLKEVEQIKTRFLEIEKDFEGREKINKQIQILKEIGIFSSNFSIDFLFSIIDNYNFPNFFRSFFPSFKLAIGSPIIVSHLTIGGRIRPLFYLEPCIINQPYKYLNGFLNGSYFNITYGFLLSYVGFAFRPVYLTIIGPKIFRTLKNPLFPFFEILTPCLGFSIAFIYVNKNSRHIELFEYNLDLCRIGFIAGC